MPISETFEQVVEDIGACGDDHINQFQPNHIGDHVTHTPRDHCPGESQEDNAFRVIEHLAKDFKTPIDIPALKGGMLEGFDQFEKVLNPLEV
jgi:hypothetical protein